jgi:hypothetical protein
LFRSPVELKTLQSIAENKSPLIATFQDLENAAYFISMTRINSISTHCSTLRIWTLTPRTDRTCTFYRDWL